MGVPRDPKKKDDSDSLLIQYHAAHVAHRCNPSSPRKFSFRDEIAHLVREAALLFFTPGMDRLLMHLKPYV
jgi:hypothetical protein